MQTGECFKDKGPHVAGVADSLPAIPCRCGRGSCKIFTSKTQKNPGRRFYKCPAADECGFFKWCDELTHKQISSRPVSGNPICPCASGPCRRETMMSGPNAGRSYFICGIKKSFGACAFFQWEDAQMPSEPEEGSHGSSSASSGVSGSGAVDETNCRVETTENGKNGGLETGGAENSSPANGFTPLVPSEENEVNQPTDGTSHVLSFKPDIECPVSAVVNGVPLEEEPNPLYSRSNSPESVPSIVLAAAGSMNQDVVHLETEEKVLDQPEEHVEAPRGEQLRNVALSEFISKESYASEVDEAMSVLLSIHEYESTSDETNSEHIHVAAEHQSVSGEIEHSFANSPSLLDLVEQYHSEKIHFDGVSVRCVEVFSAFVGSYKQLKSLHEKAYRLRKLLLQTEKQVACCEAETLEFAASVQEVSGEMNESQKRLQGTAEKLAKEIEVFKHRYFAIPKKEKLSSRYLGMNERGQISTKIRWF